MEGVSVGGGRKTARSSWTRGAAHLGCHALGSRRTFPRGQPAIPKLFIRRYPALGLARLPRTGGSEANRRKPDGTAEAGRRSFRNVSQQEAGRFPALSRRGFDYAASNLLARAVPWLSISLCMSLLIVLGRSKYGACAL